LYISSTVVSPGLSYLKDKAKCDYSYLSKKQVASMPGESFEDGGLKHNYPGRVALAEAKSLFPRHAAPIFLAAGCGKYANDDRKKKESWFVGSGLDRLHRYHRDSLDANHQFEQHHGESTNLNRLNLSMAMERPALDQVEALPQICRQVDFIIASDSQLHETQIRPTAFLWTASMLCFEFVKRPTWCGNGLHCVGYIFCRYPNRQKLTEQLRERFGEDGGFVIGDEGFDFEIPREIVFTLPSLNEEFSIRLHCHDQEAPISGFPSTAGEILALQTDWHRGQAKSNKKRNLEENADCRPLKKMRY